MNHVAQIAIKAKYMKLLTSQVDQHGKLFDFNQYAGTMRTLENFIKENMGLTQK